jgi:simple sugar transport system permease protein
MWVAAIFTFALCAVLGTLNGYLVVRTGLPSFIVTLAFYFILRGLSLALSTMLTGKTIVSNNEGIALRDLATSDYLFSTLFSGHVLTGLFNAMARWGWIAAKDGGSALAIGVPKVVVWWLVLTAIGGFVLARTRRGNWILAVGGRRERGEYRRAGRARQ